MTDPAVTTRKTTKSAVSAAHIVFRCQRVGYFCVCTLQSLIFVGSGDFIEKDHCSGLKLVGSPLLIFVFVWSIFSASFLFCGSSVIAFCQASNAWGTRFNCK